MQRMFQRVSQVSLLAFSLGAVIGAQASVPVESVQPSGYGSITSGQNAAASSGAMQSQSSAPANQADEQGSSQSSPSASWVGTLLSQVDSLQQQVKELKGQMEEQDHTIAQLQAQSKQQYLDLDRRFSQLTAASTSAVEKNTTTSPSSSANNTGTATGQITDAEAYQDAFKLISQRKFDQAIAAFSDFVTDYPKSSYISNAKYWLGEIYSATGKTDEARQEFLSVVTDYPKSKKVADAMYKLGQIYSQSGDNVQAKKYLQKVIKDYPGSSAAQLSKSFLQTLSK